MSLNNTPPPSTMHEVVKPQMQSVTIPIVNGPASSNAYHGGSMTVHQSPPAHDRAGWAGVSPVVNNTPTTNL